MTLSCGFWESPVRIIELIKISYSLNLWNLFMMLNRNCDENKVHDKFLFFLLIESCWILHMTSWKFGADIWPLLWKFFYKQPSLQLTFKISEISETWPCYLPLTLNPQAPVAQKIADKVVFRHFQGEGVEFLNRTSLTPLRFLMRIFWKLPI